MGSHDDMLPSDSENPFDQYHNDSQYEEVGAYPTQARPPRKTNILSHGALNPKSLDI